MLYQSTNAWQFELLNDLPIIQNISILPTGAVNTTGNVSCQVNITDGIQNSFNVSFEWYKNGTNQTGMSGTTINVPNNTLANISNLTSANLSAGNWSCNVRAYDGYNYSVWNMSTNKTVSQIIYGVNITQNVTSSNTVLGLNRTYLITIGNNGTNCGTQTYNLSVTNTNSATTASINQSQINVTENGTGTIVLTVGDISGAASYGVTVTAKLSTDSTVNATTSTITTVVNSTIGVCGVSIDTAGNYTLGSNLAFTGSTACIIVGVSNNNLTCAGYKITGDGTAVGIVVNSTKDSDIIEYCNITTVTTGIQFTSTSSNGIARYNNITSAGTGGISVGVGPHTINNNRIMLSGSAISALLNTAGLNASNNYVESCTTGIGLVRSSSGTYTNNTIYNVTTGIGLAPGGAGNDNNVFNNTNISDAKNFITGESGSSGNTITNTTFYNSSYGSIRFNGTITLAAGRNVTSPSMSMSLNRSFVNSTNITEFNTTAIITLFNIPFINPQPVVDLADNGTYAICTTCNEISYTTSTVTTVETRFPAADGATLEWGYLNPDPPSTHYDKLTIADDGDTAVGSDTNGNIDLYTLNTTSIPTGATINSVKIYGRFASVDGNTGIYMGFNDGTGMNWGNLSNMTDSTYTTFNTSLMRTNPNTNASWTRSQIAAMSLGVKSFVDVGATGLWLTQLYVEVNYTGSLGTYVFDVPSWTSYAANESGAGAATSCSTYTTTGILNCSDNCNISANGNMLNAFLNITGDGSLNISARIYNYSYYDIYRGNGVNTGCNITIYHSAGGMLG